MAATALRIPKDGKDVNMFFMTVPRENGGLQVDIFLADEEFIPQGQPSFGHSDLSEEEYHKQLRAEADMKGHLVKDFCTDPEWNPQPSAE